MFCSAEIIKPYLLADLQDYLPVKLHDMLRGLMSLPKPDRTDERQKWALQKALKSAVNVANHNGSAMVACRDQLVR